MQNLAAAEAAIAASRLGRTFGVDGLSCPRCRKGRLRPIAVITKDQIVSKILAHLRLPVSPQLLAGSSRWA